MTEYCGYCFILNSVARMQWLYFFFRIFSFKMHFLHACRSVGASIVGASIVGPSTINTGQTAARILVWCNDIDTDFEFTKHLGKTPIMF